MCNLKIYTGSKWINIDKSLTTDYELFEIEAELILKVVQPIAWVYKI